MPPELGHRDQVMEATSQRLHCEDQVIQEHIMGPISSGPCHQDYIVETMSSGACHRECETTGLWGPCLEDHSIKFVSKELCCENLAFGGQVMGTRSWRLCQRRCVIGTAS